MEEKRTGVPHGQHQIFLDEIHLVLENDVDHNEWL